jgi:CubicO group peptidase (beta-lactamase class C family)
MRWSLLLLLACASGPRGQTLGSDSFTPYTGDVPGASVIVVRNGEIVFRQSYGMANLEERIQATQQTQYRLASLTKQFTAAAILTLADRGKLSLDDRITRFLPTLPEKGITIRQLLTHTSGLIDYEDLIPTGTKSQLKDIDVLHLLESQSSTYFSPGSKFRYSNTGYAFLALIVERASGRRFADFLRENIFAPLGMQSTVAFEPGISTVEHRAFGYSREGNGWRRTDQSLTSAVLGDGGIYASVDDLVKWIGALEGGRFSVASQPAVETGEPRRPRYGFGWYIGEHAGKRVVFHHGETIGFRNALVRFPDRHLSVIVLTNRNEGTPYDTALAIADRF